MFDVLSGEKCLEPQLLELYTSPPNHRCKLREDKLLTFLVLIPALMLLIDLLVKNPTCPYFFWYETIVNSYADYLARVSWLLKSRSPVKGVTFSRLYTTKTVRGCSNQHRWASELKSFEQRHSWPIPNLSFFCKRALPKLRRKRLEFTPHRKKKARWGSFNLEKILNAQYCKQNQAFCKEIPDVSCEFWQRKEMGKKEFTGARGGGGAGGRAFLRVHLISYLAHSWP